MEVADSSRISLAMECRQGLHPGEVTVEALREAGCMDVVMPIPKDFMERTRYIGNLLAQMTMDNKGVKDDRLRLVVGQLCQTLSYMFNSCSWQEGELMDFDYAELQSKLGRFVKSR